jgi:hypothetical protein
LDTPVLTYVVGAFHFAFVNKVNVNDKPSVLSLLDITLAYRIIAMFTIRHIPTPTKPVLSRKIYLHNNYANVRLKRSVNTTVKANANVAATKLSNQTPLLRLT